MIPFGPWHPDTAGINVQACRNVRNVAPVVNGFRPLPGLEPASTALGAECLGAATAYDDDGDVFTFAGDATKLYKLNAASGWDDVSRTSGGAYGTGSGERWQFAAVGSLVLATTITDVVQKYLLNTSTNFEALGGTPPKARYLTQVNQFTVLGGLFEDERTIHWSGLANVEHWTPGTQSCDTQTFQSGGPVRGLLGGEVGYVFQAEAIQRMVYVPGSQEIFQFDEIEGGRGLAAPYSLVRVGAEAFYLAADGFYRFSTAGASSQPLGIGKWSRFVLQDMAPGSEQTVLGGSDPIGRFVLWGYRSMDNPQATLNRTLIYDWALDEATLADVPIRAAAQMLTQGVTLDTMSSFGNLDTLPFSLDSPVWRGGAPLLGVFGTDNKLSYFAGDNMAATLETNDGEAPGRLLIKGIRPHIDTRSATIAVAGREAEGDALSWPSDEAMEDTGVVPAWSAGWLNRARLNIPAGATWSKITGIDTLTGNRGRR